MHTWRSGYKQEAFGQFKPVVARRYFSLEMLPYIQEIFIDQPDVEKVHRAESLCEHVLSLGYNGMMFLSKVQGFEFVCDVARDYGLKVCAVKDEINAFDETIVISQVWNSSIARIDSDKGLLSIDLLLQEIEKERKELSPQSSLIFYLPSMEGSVRFWEQLLSRIPEKTVIAFPADLEDSFWDVWRKLAEGFPKTLLPLFSPTRYGGGLWPLLDPCGMQEGITGLFPHLWHGVAISCPFFPRSSSLLHCAAWGYSRMMWQPGHFSVSQLEEQWFKCFMPSLEYRFLAEALRKLTRLAIQIERFRNEGVKYSYEEQKSFLDGAFAQLRSLSFVAWNELNESIQLCITDLRLLLFHFILEHQVTVSVTVEEGDVKGSYWTKIKAVVGQTVRSGAIVQILEKPKVGSLCHWWE